MENYMMNKDFALVLEHTCTCIDMDILYSSMSVTGWMRWPRPTLRSSYPVCCHTLQSMPGWGDSGQSQVLILLFF